MTFSPHFYFLQNLTAKPMLNVAGNEVGDSPLDLSLPRPRLCPPTTRVVTATRWYVRSCPVARVTPYNIKPEEVMRRLRGIPSTVNSNNSPASPDKTQVPSKLLKLEFLPHLPIVLDCPVAVIPGIVRLNPPPLQIGENPTVGIGGVTF